MLIQTVVIAIFIGYLRGGNLKGLTKVSFKGLWLVLVAFLLQAVVHWAGVRGLKLGPAWLLPVLHTFSYFLLIAFTLLNRALPGVKLIGLGILLNLWVIGFNGGVMPVDPAFLPEAQKQALLLGQGTHALLTSASRFSWLADRFLIFAPGFAGKLLNQLFSIGDVLIDIGVLLLILERMSEYHRFRDFRIG